METKIDIILGIFMFSQLGLLQVSSMEPLVLWTQKSHAWSKIRGVTGNPDTWIQQRYKPYVQSESLKNTFKYGLTYNPTTEEVIWSDISTNNIFKQDLNSSLTKRMDNVQEIFKKDNAEFSSLAVDWLANNLYFIERTTKYIAVKSLQNSGNLYKVLLKSTIDTPVSLALDPYKGLMFWSDAIKGTIESASTSGTKQKTIVSGLWKPLGIALDIGAERIYYIDAGAGTLNRIKYDGTEKVELHRSEKTKTYFEIALHQNYIFATTGDNLQVDIHRKTGEHILSSDIDASIYHIIGLKNYQTPTHECQMKKCEHICLNVGDGNKGQCTCATGYTLQANGISCAETSPSYVMIKNNSVILSKALIDETNLAQMTLSSNVIKQGATQARSVGVHFDKGFIFYSDIANDMVYRGDKSGSTWKEITAGTRQVEGITIDWVANNLYWSDKILQHIMCSHLSGHFHKILIENLAEPRDLSIDPVNKRLIWTSNHHGYPKIEAVGLDGSGRQILVDGGNTGAFVGIVVNAVTKRIYWTNKGMGTVESVNLDGQQKQTIMGNQQFDMYGVAVYGDYLTYTKESAQTSNFYNMKENKEITNIINEWTSGSFVDNKQGFYDVALFDSYAQPMETSTCQTNNGDCSQLCFLTMSGHSCGCAIGYVLNGDGKSCISNIAFDHFLLFVDPYHKQIYQLQSNMKSFTQGMPVSRMEFPISIDFDIAERKVYWIDKETLQIKSSYLDGTDDKIVYNLPTGANAKKIAVDPVARYVFYTDDMDKALHRIEIVSGSHEVFQSNIHNPFGVAVDHNNGFVYWSNGGAIERTDVEIGDTRETIFMDNNLIITGLSFTSGVLYAGDWKTGNIYSIDTNTTSFTSTMLQNVGKEIYSIATDSAYIYYTLWTEKGVYRINRMDGGDKTLIDRDIFARITDLKAVESLLPVPAMVVPPPGVSTTIIIAAAAAGAAFLLLLLALIFGLMAARSCKKTPKSSNTSDSSGFDTNDRDAEYMMYANGAIFDNRSSNKTANNLTPKDSLSTDSGVSEMSGHSTADLINSSPDLGHSNNNNVGEHNVAFTDDPDLPQGDNPGNNIPTGIAVLPAVAPPPSKRYTKRTKSSHKKIKKPDPDMNDFNLREDKKVATVIQRLATRLRKRLSSIRYDEPSPRPGIDTTNPSDVNIEIDGATNPLRLYPEKNKMPPNKRMIHIPDKLHKEPRGWAPASHNVPRTVINTLGRAKGQAVSNFNGGDTGES